MSESKFKPHPDPEMREFEEALLRSIDEGLRGEGRLTRQKTSWPAAPVAGLRKRCTSSP